MPDTYKTVQLHNPEDTSEKWLPATVAEVVNMPGGITLLQELAKYLKSKSNSVTGAPYVEKISLDTNPTTQKSALKIETWSESANGTLDVKYIDFVDTDTTYSLAAKTNTETNPLELPNSAVELTDSNGVKTTSTVPVGALRNEQTVELVLNGNFN